MRGFAPRASARATSRSRDTHANAIGGTTYFGGSLEVQFPIWGLPRELGLKGAVFADAGTLFGYKGPTRLRRERRTVSSSFGFARPHRLRRHRRAHVQPECIPVRDNNDIRSSVGASILWKSPLGPIRFDYAFALTKDEGVIDPPTGVRVGGDQTQAFRFSGGTRF